MVSEPEEIVLVDEEGVEHAFYLYEIVEVDGNAYALLEPVESEGELVILRVEGDIETGNLVTLDDDEWDRVAAALDGRGILDAIAGDDGELDDQDEM